MDRRQFLAAIGAAGTATAAGCLGGRHDLEDPTVETDADETHLTYRQGGERLAVTSLDYGTGRPGGLVELRLSIWHRRDTTLTDLAVTIRRREPTATRPEVYVGGVSGEFPPIAQRIDPESDGRQLVVEDLSPVGEGTVTLGLFVRHFEDWPVDLTVDVAYGLSAGVLERYAIEGTAELTVAGPDGA